MGSFYGVVLEMVPLHLVATPIYMQGRLGNVVHLCVQREDMDLENRETLSATKTHIFT